MLCVYTALHLNIPESSASAWTIYLRKAKWVLVGMFAPEIVVWVAWCQRVKARKLQRQVQALWDKQVGSTPKTRGPS